MLLHQPCMFFCLQKRSQYFDSGDYFLQREGVPLPDSLQLDAGAAVQVLPAKHLCRSESETAAHKPSRLCANTN